MTVTKISEYVDADRCENCESKVIRRIYRDEEGYEFWETECFCGIRIE